MPRASLSAHYVCFHSALVVMGKKKTNPLSIMSTAALMIKPCVYVIGVHHLLKDWNSNIYGQEGNLIAEGTSIPRPLLELLKTRASGGSKS